MVRIVESEQKANALADEGFALVGECDADGKLKEEKPKKKAE